MASESLGVCQPPKPRTLPAFPVLNLPSVRSPFPAGSLETPEIRSVTEVTRHARQRARAGGAGGGACGGRGGAGSRLTGAALGAAVGRRRSRGPGSEGRGAPTEARSPLGAGWRRRRRPAARADPGPLRSATEAGGRGGPGRQSSALGLSLRPGRVLRSSAGLGLPGGRDARSPAAAPVPSESRVVVAAGRVTFGPRGGSRGGMVRAAVARGFEILLPGGSGQGYGVSLNEKS